LKESILMDAISAFGVAATAVQIVQFIGSTIQGLNNLKGKFKDADNTIFLLISRLSAIRAAIHQIRDWADYNFDDSPKEKEFLKGLNTALDGCQTVMEILSAEVKDLLAGADPRAMGMMTRVKAIWNEDTMKSHEGMLSGQIQALQLLLSAGQCRDPVSQERLLTMKQNRRLIEKVAEDTKSLRESHSSVASQAARSVRGSSATATVFEFNRNLAENTPHKSSIARRNTTQVTTPTRGITRKKVGSGTSRKDEGYETGMTMSGSSLSRNSSTTSSIDIRPLAMPDLDDLNLYSPPSVTSTESEPVHRWLSSSSSTSSPPGDRVPERKKKFWPSRVARLNTFSDLKISSISQKAQSAGPILKRKQAPTNLTQSIDFSTTDGLETPALVRVAQAGNRIEIERLLENGEDIEARHIPSQRTALAVAAHCGNFELVEFLLQHHAQAEPRDIDLSRPLHLATSRGHCKVMNVLLNEDVGIEAINSKMQTPLYVAAENGYSKAAEILLKRGAKVNTRANNQWTPLHAATDQGDKEMVDLLLRHQAHIEARDNNYMAALHHACEKGHYEVADLLIQKGANIEATGNENSMTPLLCASAAGHLPIVELLAKKKASPKSLDKKKASALHLAASKGHVEVAEYLLAWKISVHDTDINGLTPLHVAVIGSHFSAVDFLLRRHSAVNSKCREGWTPLHYACSSHNPDLVRLLINAGAESQAQIAGDGRRPIHIAVANGSVQIIEILHKHEVSISVRDSAGDRPLCIACHHGHAGAAEKLIELGEPLRAAFPNRPNEDSPLCIAAKGGHLDVIRLLFRKGASVKQRDEYGYIPLRYAAYFGHPEALRLLLEEGAELVDDGEDSNGWGFVLMPDMIGFSETSNISDERKRMVRELLEEAERNMNEWESDAGVGLRPNLARGPTRRLIGSPKLNGEQELQGSTRRPEELSSKRSLSGRQVTMDSPPPTYVPPLVGSPAHTLYVASPPPPGPYGGQNQRRPSKAELSAQRNIATSYELQG
jgi:ankyrin repeat protein